MPPCPATGSLSKLEHGWITRPDGRPGTPMRRRGRAALAAEAREGESYGHLPNPRATRHQRRRRRQARGRWPPFRRSPPSPCSAPLWCSRRISSPGACWLRRGVPARRRWWVVRRSRDRGSQGQGNNNYLPKCGRRNGGTPFIPYPAVTPGDRYRGARDRGARGGPGAYLTR